MTTPDMIASSPVDKKKSSWRKKRVAALRLGVTPIIALAVFTAPTWPEHSAMSMILEVSGYVFLLAGLVIRLWSTLYIGGRKSHELVIDGPYSLCRNPLYIGTFLIAVGSGLAFSSLSLAGLMIVVLVPAHLVVTLKEERHLLDLFPETYPQYMKSVPRYWPRLSNYRSREWLTVSSHAARRMCFNTALVLMVPPIEDLLDMLHRGVHPILPVLFRMP
jgi:protein-S-isoprenylcysteine O-methyltransferase Ste14